MWEAREETNFVNGLVNSVCDRPTARAIVYYGDRHAYHGLGRLLIDKGKLPQAIVQQPNVTVRRST